MSANRRKPQVSKSTRKKTPKLSKWRREKRERLEELDTDFVSWQVDHLRPRHSFTKRKILKPVSSQELEESIAALSNIL